jgi:hypothetical protein
MSDKGGKKNGITNKNAIFEGTVKPSKKRQLRSQAGFM